MFEKYGSTCLKLNSWLQREINRTDRDWLGRTKKMETDSYINTRMLGQTFKMLGRTLWRTFIEAIWVVFIGHNSNWQLCWAQKTDAVQLSVTCLNLTILSVLFYITWHNVHISLYGFVHSSGKPGHPNLHQ